MLDGVIREVVDAPLNRSGRRLADLGVTADAVTLLGLGLGLVAAGLLAAGFSGLVVVVFLLAGRLADGLDGAIARARGKTDFGGYLDIVCDFAFYGMIPLGFILQDPVTNAAAGAFLLTSFYINGASFLGYAAIAAKRRLESRSRGEKSLYFTAGLMEGTETILFFLAMVIWPTAFGLLAWVFGVLCLATALARVLLARRVFGQT